MHALYFALINLNMKFQFCDKVRPDLLPNLLAVNIDKQKNFVFTMQQLRSVRLRVGMELPSCHWVQ